MEFFRDSNIIIHTEHKVTADTPREASRIYKEQMQEAMDGWINGSKKDFPEYIDKDNTEVIPEMWNENLKFYGNGKTFNSAGEEISYEEVNDLYDEDGILKFVWGLKAKDDLTGLDACADTLNDIEVYCNGEEYFLFIEEIYEFENAKQRVDYLKGLRDKFKEYLMTRYDYSENSLDNLCSCSVFDCCYPTAVMQNTSELRAYTLEDLYRKFKLFIIAYESILNEFIESYKESDGKEKVSEPTERN